LFYTVYQVTNLLSGEIYVGMHKTANPDDSYLGSGLLIDRAIRAHGRANFQKKVLFIYNNPEDMQAKEAEIVTPAFCEQEDTYNLNEGGRGGWSYVNRILTTEEMKRRSAKGVARLAELRKNPDFQARVSANMSANWHETHQWTDELKARWSKQRKGKKNSEETRRKISEGLKGHKVSNETRRKIAESNRRTAARKKEEREAQLLQ